MGMAIHPVVFRLFFDNVSSIGSYRALQSCVGLRICGARSDMQGGQQRVC